MAYRPRTVEILWRDVWVQCWDLLPCSSWKVNTAGTGPLRRLGVCSVWIFPLWQHRSGYPIHLQSHHLGGLVLCNVQLHGCGWLHRSHLFPGLSCYRRLLPAESLPRSHYGGLLRDELSWRAGLTYRKLRRWWRWSCKRRWKPRKRRKGQAWQGNHSDDHCLLEENGNTEGS